MLCSRSVLLGERISSSDATEDPLFEFKLTDESPEVGRVQPLGSKEFVAKAIAVSRFREGCDVLICTGAWMRAGTPISGAICGRGKDASSDVRLGDVSGVGGADHPFGSKAFVANPIAFSRFRGGLGWGEAVGRSHIGV